MARKKVQDTKQAATMGRLWRISQPFGTRDYLTCVDLYNVVMRYFEWCENTPWEEEAIGWYKGSATRATVGHPRAFTVRGLCAFIGCSEGAWGKWGADSAVEHPIGQESLQPVVEWANAIIYEQKFTGAAAGLFNAGIITRDLGLVDKAETKSDSTIAFDAKVLEDAQRFTSAIAGLVTRSGTTESIGNAG